jgi:hypothetical protein
VQDTPPPAAILDLAIAQLKSVELNGGARAKFEMRLTTAALQLVRRAMELAPASDAAEHERLSALLVETGDLEQLNRRLCALIRDGTYLLSTPGVAAHLRATTLEKLAIDQPTYASYRRALERTGG